MDEQKEDWVETKVELQKLVRSSRAVRVFMILWFFTAFCAFCWIAGMADIFLRSPMQPDSVHSFQYPNHGKPIYATGVQARFTSYAAIGFQFFLLIIMPLASIVFYFNDAKFKQFARRLYRKPTPKK